MFPNLSVTYQDPYFVFVVLRNHIFILKCGTAVVDDVKVRYYLQCPLKQEIDSVF